MDFAPAQTANAARGKNLDARQRRDDHGRCHRGGSVQTTRNHHGQVTTAHLDDLAALAPQIVNLFGRQARTQTAVDDGNRCWDRTLLAHDGLDVQRGLDVLWIRHTVANDGRLERHYGAVLRKCGSHLGRDVKVCVQILHGGSFLFQRRHPLSEQRFVHI